jgi:hypothetical protein
VANRVLREPESLRISYSIFWLQERVLKGLKKAYPNITDEDIRACLLYASILADEEAGVTA